MDTQVDGETFPDDLELRLAHQLLSDEVGLHRGILMELLGRPRRYGELKPLLSEDKSENSLTVALKTLQRNGLVDRRTDARSSPPVHRYEISPLGIEVVFVMRSLGRIDAHLADLRSALAAAPGERKGLLPLESPEPTTSTDRPIWHVSPDPSGGWRVEREGAKRATRVCPTKREAVDAARELAAKREHGRVMLHKADGSFQRQIVPA